MGPRRPPPVPGEARPSGARPGARTAVPPLRFSPWQSPGTARVSSWPGRNRWWCWRRPGLGGIRGPGSAGRWDLRGSRGDGEPHEEGGRGAEAEDQDDEPSLEVAVAGAYGALVVTNVWEHCSKEEEIAQQPGEREAADGGPAGGVPLRWQRRGGGVLPGSWCSHHDHLIAVLLQELPLHLQAAEGPAGRYLCPGAARGGHPHGRMAVEDVGPVVLCLLKFPEECISQVIELSTGKLTEAEYAAVLSQQMGKTVEASKIAPEAYEQRGSAGAKETAARFRFYTLQPDHNVDLTMKLTPKAHTFRQWAADDKAAF